MHGTDAPDDALEVVSRDGVFVMQYPRKCSGASFEAAYASASLELQRQPEGVVLMHDLRRVALTQLDRRAVLQDANDIASCGRIHSVAFVLDCNSFWESVISGFVERLSPIQPSKVFGNVEDARNWCLSTRPPSSERESKPVALPCAPEWVPPAIARALRLQCMWRAPEL
jgi:hypothetical protein